jgi:hypothetical protein
VRGQRIITAAKWGAIALLGILAFLAWLLRVAEFLIFCNGPGRC